MTLIEEQDCPHVEMSPAMKKYSTIDINEYTKVGDTVGYTEEGNPIVYDPGKVAGHAAAMDYVKKFVVSDDQIKELVADDPITQVICTNPPIYKTESGKEYYDNAKTKPANMETANYMLTHGYEFQITGLTDKDGNTYDWSGSLKCDLPSSTNKSNEKYSDGPFDYEPTLGNDKKWDSCSDSTKSHYDGVLPSITTDYETAKHHVDDYIKTLNDKKVISTLENDYKFVNIFNENLADRDILSVTLTLRPDVGTIDFICDMMDAKLPFDLHFTQNGVVEIYYDRRD